MDSKIFTREYKKFKNESIIGYKYSEKKVHGNKNYTYIFKRNKGIYIYIDKNFINKIGEKFCDKHTNETNSFDIKKNIKNLLRYIY